MTVKPLTESTGQVSAAGQTEGDHFNISCFSHDKFTIK